MSDQHLADRRAARSRGRPKLGVVGREVTLLPDHWAWLNTQPGGASVALRTLVDAARRRDGAVPADVSASTPALPDCLAPLVPADKHAAIQRCLETALDRAPIASAVRLPSGAGGAAIVLRLCVRTRTPPRNTRYLLRIEGPPGPFRDARRHYTCWRIAAEAQVAPRLLQADADAGIALAEFLEPTPPDKLPGRVPRIRAILDTLKRLHDAPLFPPGPPYVDVIDSLLAQCQATGILEKEAVRSHFARHGELAAAYRRLPPDPVSSHNDLNPSNVVFTRGRAWLVDWESAFAADRYIDLAALTQFQAVNRYDEEMVLRLYFGAALSDRHRARAFLMQQLNRLFYALVLLNGVAAVRPQVRLSAEQLAAAPGFAAVRGELAALATTEGQLRFGAVFLNEMKGALESARFQDSIRALAAMQ